MQTWVCYGTADWHYAMVRTTSRGTEAWHCDVEFSNFCVQELVKFRQPFIQHVYRVRHLVEVASKKTELDGNVKAPRPALYFISAKPIQPIDKAINHSHSSI